MKNISNYVLQAVRMYLFHSLGREWQVFIKGCQTYQRGTENSHPLLGALLSKSFILPCQICTS